MLTKPFCRLLIVASASLLMAQPAWAQSCAVAGMMPPEVRDDGRVSLSADSIDATRGGISQLSGDVQLQYRGTRLRTPSLRYDQRTGEAATDGGADFANRAFSIGADDADVDLSAGTAHFEGARFTLFDRGARGRAASIDLSDDVRAQLDDVAYTTCPPEQPDWTLRGSRITLNPDTGLGTARNARVSFFGVPIIYLPYFTFPIDDRRRTGFLVPDFGDSDTTGVDISAPFYINISPALDATVTPRYMARRGNQLKNSFRYLLADDWGRGEVQYEVLPNDEVLDESRSLISYAHEGRLSDRWGLLAQFTEVSDRGYLEDLGTTLDLAAITHLKREARLAYQAPAWFAAQLTVEDYQTVDRSVTEADEPYRRLPRLQISALSPNDWNRFRIGLDSEYVNFEREGAVEGTRLDLRPYVSYRKDAVGWFAGGQIDYRRTDYNLRRAGDTQSSFVRGLPSLSLDAGLRFDRDVGGGVLQTLEPRLFYLYAPFRDQQGIPVFETALPEFSFVQLFARNRYSGLDRIADANQVTAAVTTRLLEVGTGRTLLEAALGQIYRFQPSQVSLDDMDTARRENSDIIGTVRYNTFSWLSAVMGIQWDPARTRTNRGYAAVEIRPNNGYRLDIAYRFRRDLLEQTDLVASLPLGANWSAVGRWNFSITDSSTRESLLGVEYRSCCWAARVAGRRYIANTLGEFNTSLYLQLELTGLSRIGAGIQELLPP
ncbi:LPS assembly protein LptD [bacterium]|nr:LPS assembly protein LptD [bacterium]